MIPANLPPGSYRTQPPGISGASVYNGAARSARPTTAAASGSRAPARPATASSSAADRQGGRVNSNRPQNDDPDTDSDSQPILEDSSGSDRDNDDYAQRDKIAIEDITDHKVVSKRIRRADGTRQTNKHVKLLCEWEDGSKSWNWEADIETDAANTVYQYWRRRGGKGGRCAALGLDTDEMKDRAEYWPERIERTRKVGNKEPKRVQYKVKWVGYPSTRDNKKNETWDLGTYLPRDFKQSEGA